MFPGVIERYCYMNVLKLTVCNYRIVQCHTFNIFM